MSMVFFTPGVPAPKGSKIRNTYGGMREANPSTMPWVQAVAWHAREAAMRQGRADGAALLAVWFRFRRPASHYRVTKRDGRALRRDAPVMKASKPDADKLLRAVMDGATASGLWRDDSLCAWPHGVKTYVADGEPVGALVRVHRVDDADDMAEWREALMGLCDIAEGMPAGPLWLVPGQ